MSKLTGYGLLSGVDLCEGKYMDFWDETYETTNAVRFKLNGVTYKAIENPDDGYRSYCEELVVSEEKIKNAFPPQKVEVRIYPSIDGSMDEILQFIDFYTRKVVLEVGTDRSCSYYPFCHFKWYPENLTINQEL